MICVKSWTVILLLKTYFQCNFFQTLLQFQMIFIPKAQTDPWQTPLPPLAWSWHVYTPPATHMHSQTHTYAVKVWKRLSMIMEPPNAPQGINNRLNTETTNTISRLQREMGGSVCGCMNIWLAFFTFACLCLHVYVYILVSECLLWPSVIVLLTSICMSVNNEPHTSSIPQGYCDLPGPVGFYTAIPRRHLHPRKINN